MTWTTMMRTTNSEETGGSGRRQEQGLAVLILALMQKNPFDLQPAPASCSYFLLFPA